MQDLLYLKIKKIKEIPGNDCPEESWKMGIKVMLMFSNTLFSDGIQRVLEGDPDIKSIEVLPADYAQGDKKIESSKPDVILVDIITLYNGFSHTDSSGKNRFILLDTGCGRDNIVAAVLSKKVSGVLLSNATPQLLKKALTSVANGEIWLDKTTVKDLLYGINAIGKDKNSALSAREQEVAALIGHGFTNKEVADKLNVSEPTVKTHLNHIFQKLGIKNRSQLVSYSLKNNDASGKALGSVTK